VRVNFWLSTAALLLGPLIYAWGRSRPVWKQLLDGFVVVAIAGIVCVNIIPVALDLGGWLALLALAAGLSFPVVIEKLFHRSMHRAHGFVVVLAAIGLVLHAVIDGLALLPALQEHLSLPTWRATAAGTMSLGDNPLALGVIVHRIPVGMALWWSVRPQFGLAVAMLSFALLIAATGLAYVFGSAVVDVATTQSLALFQAFVAGSLVHVVTFGVSHRHHDDGAFVPADNWGFRAGILLGMFVLFAVPHLH
jgi:uncharacterized protein